MPSQTRKNNMKLDIKINTVSVWDVFIWLGIQVSSGSCEGDNGHLVSIKGFTRGTVHNEISPTTLQF
jgi:hypothetical protein